VRVNGVNIAGQTAVSAVKGNGVTAVKALAGCVWRPKMTDLNNVSKDNSGSWVSKRGNPQQALKNKGIFDSGCSRHMTGNKDFLEKNNVLFTETECLVLSPDFKLLDESQVLLRVPRQSNMYSFDLKNVVPSGDLTCLFAKATIDESKLWHRRLGHVNFKTMNKLVKGNLVRGPQEANGNTADDAAGETLVQKPASESEQASKNVLDKMTDQEKEATEKSNAIRKEFEAQCNRKLLQRKSTRASSTNSFNTVRTTVNAASAPRTSNDVGPSFVPLGGSFPLDVNDLPDDPLMPDLEDTAEDGCTRIQTRRGIDYDEVYALVARIKAIRLFLAYASFMNFLVDVKSAFLYGTIEEKVYVSQPLGFVDPEFPKKVYKVEKALYGLHQPPRAWYETLSTYMLENGFYRRQIDKTLFIKRVKSDILLVQVYVDDIIFGSTKKSLCTDFEQIMHKRFQMSSMGELTFFLGLQVKQKEDGIFISRPNEDGEDVDIHLYRSMIVSLMYLTSSRPDIMFSVYTKIHVDNESAICVVKNLVYHSKTKHIEIRHHFIKDSYEKRLIEMVKIHTDNNVADLLTKSFDGRLMVYKYSGLYTSVIWIKVRRLNKAVWLDLVRSYTTGSLEWNGSQLFVDQHNMVACLEKLEENIEFHQIVDFFSTCSINYALTVSPTIYASYIKQFWNTATFKTVNSLKKIHAIVDGKAVVISESLVRSDLLFNDEDGIACLTNDEIFENLALMGYEQLSTKPTFQKGSFSPQWKFLIHTILHCISSKSTAWNEFSTNLASAVICLAKGQKRTKKVTKLPQTSVPQDLRVDEAVHKERGDSVERAITTEASLDTAQGMDTGDSPRRQDTMGGAHAQTRSERVLEKPNEPPLIEGHTSGSGEGSMEYHFELTDNVPPIPHDSPLSGGNTPGSDEGRMELIKELMETCTSLTKRVLALEEAHTA
ncbi:putative ribonuclease H-like domain-containing protein, partial [Tanacetum coccineum]